MKAEAEYFVGLEPHVPAVPGMHNSNRGREKGLNTAVVPGVPAVPGENIEARGSNIVTLADRVRHAARAAGMPTDDAYIARVIHMAKCGAAADDDEAAK